jgi:hypothetical protein
MVRIRKVCRYKDRAGRGVHLSVDEGKLSFLGINDPVREHQFDGSLTLRFRSLHPLLQGAGVIFIVLLVDRKIEPDRIDL